MRLHLAELSWTAAGQRVFNVAINGTTVLSNFDIFATSGAQNRALTEEFTAVANSSGAITIAFTQGTADNPEVNGIEVVPMDKEGSSGGLASLASRCYLRQLILSRSMAILPKCGRGAEWLADITNKKYRTWVKCLRFFRLS